MTSGQHGHASALGSNRPAALIALGANLPSSAGAPAQTICAALARLDARGALVRHRSRLYATPCFPVGAGPDYVNAAAALEWEGSAHDLLSLLHAVEAEFGRERKERWGMRSLDLDLIALRNTVLPDPRTQTIWRDLSQQEQRGGAPEELILPHPRLQDRAFVLVPMMDIAPDWIHPVTNKSVADMHRALPLSHRQAIRALPAPGH